MLKVLNAYIEECVQPARPGWCIIITDEAQGKKWMYNALYQPQDKAEAQKAAEALKGQEVRLSDVTPNFTFLSKPS